MPLRFRVQLFVASFAHAHKLPLSSGRVDNRERKVWAVFQVLDMMDEHRTAVPSPLFASLAFVAISLKHRLSR